MATFTVRHFELRASMSWVELPQSQIYLVSEPKTDQSALTFYSALWIAYNYPGALPFERQRLPLRRDPRVDQYTQEHLRKNLEI